MSVPPCRLLAEPIDDTVTSILAPGLENAGSEPVTMTAATFLALIWAGST